MYFLTVLEVGSVDTAEWGSVLRPSHGRNQCLLDRASFWSWGSLSSSQPAPHCVGWGHALLLALTGPLVSWRPPVILPHTAPPAAPSWLESPFQEEPRAFRWLTRLGCCHLDNLPPNDLILAYSREHHPPQPQGQPAPQRRRSHRAWTTGGGALEHLRSSLITVSVWDFLRERFCFSKSDHDSTYLSLCSQLPALEGLFFGVITSLQHSRPRTRHPGRSMDFKKTGTLGFILFVFCFCPCWYTWVSMHGKLIKQFSCSAKKFSKPPSCSIFHPFLLTLEAKPLFASREAKPLLPEV